MEPTHVTAIASPLLPGEILGKKYVVERTLGQGGMGIVVAARHLELDQTVAIKFLFGDAPPNALERFMREARAAALVKSEHVCRVYDIGRLETGEPYIVMEYLEGLDLSEKLASEGRQPLEQVIGWVIEACEALAQAHARGIVHRDLKPANLFLHESDGATTIKVVDFGISKLPTSGALTHTAAMMGSPLYMSPEQLESSRDVDARSDVWSLGVVLYELLTGEPPFNGESLVQLAVQAREKEPIAPSILQPEISAELEDVILKCLAKSPAARYQSVAELAVDLAPFAPPDVKPILAKLAKASAQSRRSDPALATLKTVPGTPPSRRSVLAKESSGNGEPSSDPAIVAAPASAPQHGRTFAPVQTRAKARTARNRRWAFLGVMAVAALAGVLLIRQASHRAPAPSHLVQTPPVLPPTEASGLPLVAAPATTTVATPATASESASPTRPPEPPPVATVPPPATRPRPRGPVTSSAALVPAPATTDKPEAARPEGEIRPLTPPAKKKHELDRSYEP